MEVGEIVDNIFVLLISRQLCRYKSQITLGVTLQLYGANREEWRPPDHHKRINREARNQRQKTQSLQQQEHGSIPSHPKHNNGAAKMT